METLKSSALAVLLAAAVAPVASAATNGFYAPYFRGVPGTEGAVDGVASLGTRPTVGGVEPLLEVHVFDFSGDLYGRRIEVEFIARLRDEERFDSLPALVAQMEADARRARQILAARAA